jgi:hypothetical protein
MGTDRGSAARSVRRRLALARRPLAALGVGLSRACHGRPAPGRGVARQRRAQGFLEVRLPTTAHLLPPGEGTLPAVITIGIVPQGLVDRGAACHRPSATGPKCPSLSGLTTEPIVWIRPPSTSSVNVLTTLPSRSRRIAVDTQGAPARVDSISPGTDDGGTEGIHDLAGELRQDRRRRPSRHGRGFWVLHHCRETASRAEH